MSGDIVSDDVAGHQAHGRCGSCGYPVHHYPFGWQHVGTGMFSCADLVPVVSCCPSHVAVIDAPSEPSEATA